MITQFSNALLQFLYGYIHGTTDMSLFTDEILIQYAILVDALVNDNSPGSIVCLAPEELAACPVTPLSSHGTRVADAIGLLRVLAPDTAGCEIQIIGISIAPPKPYSRTLSAPVAVAVARAVNLIPGLPALQINARAGPACT